MVKAGRVQNLHQFMLCALAFTIPMPYIYSSICIIGLAITWLLQGDFKTIFENLAQRKVLWAWLAYYLLLAVSYYYSADKHSSVFDLKTKISLFLMPIIIGCGRPINRKNLEQIFITFICGLSFTAIYCITKACILWEQTHDKQVFFYHNLVKGLSANAVYMAWYVIFAICMLLFISWQYYFKNRYISIKIILTVLLIAFFILLAARMLIVLFFLILIPFYLNKIFKYKKFSIFKSILVCGALLILITALVIIKNPIRDRYENILQNDFKNAWLDDYSNVSEGDFSNLTLRLFIWRMGMENMSEKNLWLTGGGNGDTRTLMNEKLKEHGFRNIHPDAALRSPFYNINLHNMFLQSLLMIGLPGLILFMIMVIAPFVRINKKTIHKGLFIIFHITAILFFMQEAALQTQAGIIYYAFFATIFWNLNYSAYKDYALSFH